MPVGVQPQEGGQPVRPPAGIVGGVRLTMRTRVRRRTSRNRVLPASCLAILVAIGSGAAPGTDGVAAAPKVAARPVVAFGDFSVLLWIKTDGYRTGEVFRQHDERGGGRGITVQLTDRGPSASLIGPRDRISLSAALGEPLTPNEWHLVSVMVGRRHDPSAELWLDGRMVAKAEAPAPLLATSQWLPASDSLQVRLSGVEARAEVRLGEALSASELLLLFLAGPTPTAQPEHAVAVDTSLLSHPALSLRLWPMPVRDLLRLEYHLSRPGPLSVTISDVQGRECFGRDYGWRSRGRGELRLGPDILREFPAGCYYLRVRSGDAVVVRRLIILP